MTALASTRPGYGEAFRMPLRDGVIAGRRWRRQGAPRLLFCHATGFCASAYRAMLSDLARRFDVIALDLRGHGRSALPADPAHLSDWSPFARDIGEAADRLLEGDQSPLLLAGHSLGAAAVLLAARARRDVAGLVLIEPVVVSRLIACAARTPFWPMIAARIPLVRGARSRRAVWPDRKTALDSYARKALFSTWAEGVLEDYLEDSLIEEAGGARLACAPEWEAAVFAAQANWIWPAAARAPAPITVIAVEHPSSTVSPAARGRFRRLGARLEIVSGATHLLPFERPAFVAERLAAAARRGGGGKVGLGAWKGFC